jgi:nucleoredoxin
MTDIRASNKTIGVYFSARKDEAAAAVTAQLTKAYSSHLKANGLEVIFASADASAADFMASFGTMPWLAIPFEDRRAKKLQSMFKVNRLPSLVLIDAATGATITRNAIEHFVSDPAGTAFPWPVKPLIDITANELGWDITSLTDTVTLCVLLDGCDETTTRSAIKALEHLAAARQDANLLLSGPLSSMFTYGSSGADALLSGPLFTYVSKDSAPEAKYVRALTNAGAARETPQVLLLDSVESGAFYVSDATEVTVTAMKSFLAAFKEGRLEADRQQITGGMRKAASAAMGGS